MSTPMTTEKPAAARSAKADPGTAVPAGPEAGELDRHAWLTEAAYYRAQARGFAAGRELDDWLEAENALAAASRGQATKNAPA